MATTPYLRRWTETKQNKNKLKIKKTNQINKQLDYMKPIYNFKINDSKVKNIFLVHFVTVSYSNKMYKKIFFYLASTPDYCTDTCMTL